MKRLLSLFAVLTLSAAVVAQSNNCPTLVYESMLEAGESCDAIGRNEVCYGSTSIEVQARGDADLNFAQPGDTSAVVDIESIQTSPLDAMNEEFGIALMQVQADVPGVLPGQVVTFLMMGDVELTDMGQAADAPMQVFQFRTGIGAPACDETNFDTLVIDTPDGVTVNFTMNGVDIELGSTAVLIGEPNNVVDMLVTEGEGQVTANGDTVTVTAGNWTQIEMDAETGTQAISAPADPTPFEPERIAHIPFDLLFENQNVALGKPVTADTFLETDPPEYVVNGFATGGDNWNAGSEPPHWIEIDLLQDYPISQIRLFTSQFPPEQLDPTVHSILVRGEDESDYREVHVFAQETRDDEWLEFIPDTPVLDVRYVRVLTTSSIHWTSWGEIEVYAAGFYGCLLDPINTGTNLRQEAAIDSDVLATLSDDDILPATAYTMDADGMLWWQTERDDGWIRGDLVTEQGYCNLVPQN